MASELPDDITSIPATFKTIGETVNALLAFSRAWEKAAGKNGISITQSSDNIVIGLDGALQQLLLDAANELAISKTFLVSGVGADLAVSAGAINSVAYAGATISAPANGDKVYIDATIDGAGAVTALTVSAAAAVPADTSTHVYTLLATVAVAQRGYADAGSVELLANADLRRASVVGRLWRMSSAGSIIGQCADCCDCPEPRFVTAINTATFSKLGCVEPVSPLPAIPKYYRQVTYSGQIVATNSNANPAEEYTLDLRPTATPTYYAPRPGEGGGSDAELLAFYPDSGSAFTTDCPYDESFGEALRSVLSAYTCDLPLTSVNASSTTVTYASSASPDCSLSISTNTLTATFSVEHTTAQLLEDVVAVLPGYGSFSVRSLGYSPSSALSLSSDEIDALARGERYRLAFRIPAILTCYRATWIERFTPVSGTPTETEREAQWDGTTPSGYDPLDPDTWPVLSPDGTTSTYWELDIPSSLGETTIENFVWTCRGCTPP